jgi:hypothetical protein
MQELLATDTSKNITYRIREDDINGDVRDTRVFSTGGLGNMSHMTEITILHDVDMSVEDIVMTRQHLSLGDWASHSGSNYSLIVIVTNSTDTHVATGGKTKALILN